MSAPEILSLQKIGMTFDLPGGGSVEVLDDFSLTIPKHETVALVGPSGCGKTTLLKIAAGLLEPQHGTALVAGLAASVARRQRAFSFMFQRPVLIPWLTIQRNVELAGRVAHDDAAVRQAAPLLEMVGLGEFRDAYPHQLSGGMQSRAALARALSFQPLLLLMDEPFGALDDMTRRGLQDEALDLLQSDGPTIALVTHSIDEAIYMSDRVIVLTPRPSRIILDLPIDLPRPRHRVARRSPEFAQYREAVQDALFSENGLTKAVALPDDLPTRRLAAWSAQGEDHGPH